MLCSDERHAQVIQFIVSPTYMEMSDLTCIDIIEIRYRNVCIVTSFQRLTAISYIVPSASISYIVPSASISYIVPSASISYIVPSASISYIVPSASISYIVPSASISYIVPSASISYIVPSAWGDFLSISDSHGC